jgi:hypothetical protein
MVARVLCLVLVLRPTIKVAQAQVRIAAYAAGALGISDIRTRIPIQTNPPTANSFAEHSSNVLAAMTVGLQLGHHFALDAGLRSTVEIGVPFRVLSFGPAVRWGQRVRVHVRGSVARVQGFQGVSCVATTSSCPRYASEWLNGFDLEAGVDVRSRGRWTTGPVLWWAQSTGGTTQYRSLGMGARVRYR